MQPNVIEINSPEEYQQQVIDASSQTLVVADFWASWCQPCQILVPILTRLAEEYGGAFTLAKINSDDNQELAMQNGVRSLPTVFLYKDGQVVDSFMGAIPESEIREKIDALAANPVNDAMHTALDFLDQGDSEQALAILKELNQQDPQNYKIHLAIANVYLKTQQLDLCKDLLNALPANVQMEDAAKSISAQLEVALSVNGAPAEEELLKQIESEPDNLDLKLQLANINTASQKYEEALENLFLIIQKDQNHQDGIAKTKMLKIFEMLGGQGDLVRKYRQKLFSFLN